MSCFLKKNKKNEKSNVGHLKSYITNRKKERKIMSHKSTKTYGTDSLTGSVLGVGTDGQYLNVTGPAAQNGVRGPDTRNSTKVFQSGGTINYIRQGPIITVDNVAANINNIDSKDFTLSANGSRSVEQHTSKTGRKRHITSMDIHGIITRGATDGVSYGYAPGTGTPVDKPNDSARDPWGTPPNFVFLQSSGPTVHAFNYLTSN
jgi:hypothetical protein